MGKKKKKTTKKAKSRRRGAGRSGSKNDAIRGGLTRTELISAVCHLLCKGTPAAEIGRTLNGEYPGLDLTREEPYAIVQDAGRRGWLMYRPPQHVHFREEIRKLHPWLESVAVANTTTVADVAAYTARELLGIVRARVHAGARTVRIGFAGGHAMRRVAQEFAIRLCDPVEDLPDEIWFHALATGFDPEDPTTDPNAFVTFFHHLKPVIQVKARFRGLSAPAMGSPDELAALRRLDDIARAFDAVNDLDIIVTSGTLWSDEHGALHRRMRPAGADAILAEKNCIGDVLWRPLARTGPIVAETALRALTLVELTDLPRLIQEGGKRVLLMLAPCGMCHAPKGELLDVVLGLDRKQQIVTDVVVDSVSAGQMLRSKRGAA